MKTYAALDLGALLPLIPIAAWRGEAEPPPRFVPLRAALSAAFVGTALWPLPWVAAALAAACVLLWWADPVPTSDVAKLSPLSYLCAVAVENPTQRWVLRVANAVTAILVGILSVSKQLDDAWGCYGSASPPSSWNRGMCGYGNPGRNNPPADICVGLGPTCELPNSGHWRSYGTLVAAVAHTQVVVATVMAVNLLKEENK